MLRNVALAALSLSLLAAPLLAGPVAAKPDSGKSDSGKSDRSPLLRRAMATSLRTVPASHAVALASCSGRPASGGHGVRCRQHHHAAAFGGWTQGLPPALGVQAQDCPSGTMATLAQGHEDVVRCIPM